MRDSSALLEDSRYLVIVAAAPTIWFVHFLVVYVVPAVWCARFNGSAIAPVRVAVVAVTVFALIAIALVGWSGHRRHRHGRETAPHDSDTPEDRHRFLGFATLLLAGLSGIATIAVGAAVLAFDTCRP